MEVLNVPEHQDLFLMLLFFQTSLTYSSSLNAFNIIIFKLFLKINFFPLEQKYKYSINIK